MTNSNDKATPTEKNYIGKEEAFEIALSQGFQRLPRSGREYITAYSIAEKTMTGKNDFALGKDEQGYYIKNI